MNETQYAEAQRLTASAHRYLTNSLPTGDLYRSIDEIIKALNMVIYSHAPEPAQRWPGGAEPSWYTPITAEQELRVVKADRDQLLERLREIVELDSGGHHIVSLPAHADTMRRIASIALSESEARTS